jgi:ELWxxDGT repeat protein
MEYWTSDGTAEGTTMVKEITPRAAGSSPVHRARVGERLWFAAADGSIQLIGAPLENRLR